MVIYRRRSMNAFTAAVSRWGKAFSECQPLKFERSIPGLGGEGVVAELGV